MYGYVVPIKDKLAQADFFLYRAFYCGICKSLGRQYGQMPRFTTNYDIVFLNLLLHDVTKQEVKFENSKCVCNPFKKKTTACGNDLFDKVVTTNVILSYYKACDDVIDDGAKKKLARCVMKKPYKKAKALLPEVDQAISLQYNRLRELERQNYAGIDRVSDCFATLLMNVAKALLPDSTDEKLFKLCYNVGKFVYLADALDDIGDDYKKKRYNPFLAEIGGYKSRTQFITDNKDALQFIFASTINRAIENFNNMIFTEASDLLSNVVHLGLRAKVAEIFESEKRLPKPKI